MKRVERVRAQTNLQKEIKYPSVHQKRTGCFIETLYLLAITVFNVTFVEHILCVCLCVSEWVCLYHCLCVHGPACVRVSGEVCESNRGADRHERNTSVSQPGRQAGGGGPLPGHRGVARLRG